MLEAGKDYVFLAVTANAWGKSELETIALGKALQNERLGHVKYLVYLVDPKTIVTETGDLEYPEGGREPILLRRVGE